MAETSTATELHWWHVPWAGGGYAGSRRIRAPDAESAAHDLRTHPSEYGIPCETPLVGKALRVVRIEPDRGRLHH